MSNWYDRGIAGLQGVYSEAVEDSSEAMRAASTGEITYAESALRQVGSAATIPSYALDSAFSPASGVRIPTRKNRRGYSVRSTNKTRTRSCLLLTRKP